MHHGQPCSRHERKLEPKLKLQSRYGKGQTWLSQSVHEWYNFLSPFSLAEVSRVYLRHLEDVENSDYINACFVDVSHCFIEGGHITQCPHPLISIYLFFSSHDFLYIPNSLVKINFFSQSFHILPNVSLYMYLLQFLWH